jgi:predicted polyphosphate/ATP-dependent NAD kinase
MKPMSRQRKWYYDNKKKAVENTMTYRKRLMAIGKYAMERKLITNKDLKKLETFIFGNTVKQIVEKMKIPSEKRA